MLPDIHTFIHTYTLTHTDGGGVNHARRQASSSRAVRVRRLAPGHLDTPLGGAGDRTSNIAVTSQPAVPPAAPEVRARVGKDGEYLQALLVLHPVLPLLKLVEPVEDRVQGADHQGRGEVELLAEQHCVEERHHLQGQPQNCIQTKRKNNP